jgi:hypothetical protein
MSARLGETSYDELRVNSLPGGAAMNVVAGPATAGGDTSTQLRAPAEGALHGQGLLRIVLVAQILLGLLWGVSMLFFASAIVLEDNSGAHIEKIALEGGAHLMLVLGAVLVWRAPRQAGDVLLLMIFLNGLWTLTDLVYIPILRLTAIDFYAKVVVNAALAISLAVAGRRAGILHLRSH